MKITLVVTTIIVISVCLCAGTEIRNRRRRSISDSTRFHNEHDNSDQRVHRSRSNVNGGYLGPTDATETCIPGTRWKEDCNNCFCSSRGVAACTLMACLGSNSNSYQQYKDQHRQSTDFHNSITQHRESPNRIRRSENNIDEIQQSTLPTPSCEPGTRWKQACNTCWCTETGVGVCTLMGCFNFEIKPHKDLTSNRRKRSSQSGMTRSQNSTPENETRCKHGNFWMDDCNRCRCLRGRYACTRMACPGGEKRTNMRTNQSSNRQKID